MIAVGPHAAFSSEQSVDSARQAYRKPLYASRKRSIVIALDDQMQVVALDAPVRNPESGFHGTTNRLSAEPQHSTKRRHSPADAEGDVHWVAILVRLASHMRHAGDSPRSPFSAGASASTAPSTKTQG